MRGGGGRGGIGGFANVRNSLTDPFDLVDFNFSTRRKRLLVALLVVGLASLIALTSVVRTTAVPKLEQRLEFDVKRSLADDVTQLRVSVDGRSVRVAGIVDSATERAKVVERVRGRWGVRNVNAEGLKIK